MCAFRKEGSSKSLLVFALFFLCANLNACDGDSHDNTVVDPSGNEITPTGDENPPVFEELLIVSPRKGLMTTESGGETKFSIALAKAPTADVTVKLLGAPDTEGRIDSAQTLVFDQDNWDTAQEVRVVGVEDGVDRDGNQIFTVSFDVSSQDANYDKVKVAPLEIVNVEDKSFGTQMQPQTLNYLVEDEGLETDEHGTRAYLVFQLSNRPAYDVKVHLESTVPSEAVPERSFFVIEPDQWRQLIDVPIIGVPDDVKDGDKPFKIKMRIETDDPSIKAETYNLMAEQWSNEVDGICYDVDNEPLNGLIVEKVKSSGGATRFFRKLEVMGTVSEDGTCVDYSVKLKASPKNGATVLVAGLVTNPREGKIAPAMLEFTDKNWNKAQKFQICGVDDDVVDGDVIFGVRLITFSDDLACNDLESETIVLLNEDNDDASSIGGDEGYEGVVADLIVSKKYDVLHTSESGKNNTFSVKLSRQLDNDVEVCLLNPEPGEVIIEARNQVEKPRMENLVVQVDESSDPEQEAALIEFLNAIKTMHCFTITPLDWNTQHEVRLIGLDDSVVDGDVEYGILVTAKGIMTEKEKYGFVDLVMGINFDNDKPGSSQPTSGTEDEGISTFSSDLFYFSGAVACGTEGKCQNNILGDTPRTIWVALAQQPESEVRMSFHLNKAAKSQGACLVPQKYPDACNSNHTITFKPENYYEPQPVTLSPGSLAMGLEDGQSVYINVNVSKVVSEDLRYNQPCNAKFQFNYTKGNGFVDLADIENTTPEIEPEDDSTPPRLEFTPDICKSTGKVNLADGTSQKYDIHLANQPKNNVKVKFSIPTEYQSRIKFKNNKSTLTFKPANYHINQSIEVVSVTGNTDKSALVALNYTMESADANFNGDDPNGCTPVLHHSGKTAQETPTPKESPLRIMSANATSGDSQLYEQPGMNMMFAMDPDIIIIQEFTSSAEDVIRQLESRFKTKYSYHKGRGRIGNGIIVKGENKIKSVHTRPSILEFITDREYDAAIVDIPGPKDMLVVSLHLYTKVNTNIMSQLDEYPAVFDFIQEIRNTGDYYVVVGGDFNSTSNQYVNMYWSSLLATDAAYPRDQDGNYNTNAARRRHYDWILVDREFQAFSVPTKIGNQLFPHGYVLDSRVHSPLSEIAPVCAGDSNATNFQHMPVVRDFIITH